jgi:hypothetical protein
MYDGLIDRFVLDETDAALTPEIEALGLQPVVLQTVMRTDADRRSLAEALVQGA